MCAHHVAGARSRKTTVGDVDHRGPGRRPHGDDQQGAPLHDRRHLRGRPPVRSHESDGGARRGRGSTFLDPAAGSQPGGPAAGCLGRTRDDAGQCADARVARSGSCSDGHPGRSECDSRTDRLLRAAHIGNAIQSADRTTAIDWPSMDMSALQACAQPRGQLQRCRSPSRAGAVRRFLGRKHTVVDLTFRAFVPVSTRTSQQRGALGNRVAGWIVDLPIDEPDARRRLERVSERTDHLKRTQAAHGTELLTDVLEWTGALLGLAMRMAARASLFNLVVTNVPGPPTPLYLLGARMLGAYPLVPLFGPGTWHRAFQQRESSSGASTATGTRSRISTTSSPRLRRHSPSCRRPPAETWTPTARNERCRTLGTPRSPGSSAARSALLVHTA